MIEKEESTIATKALFLVNLFRLRNKLSKPWNSEGNQKRRLPARMELLGGLFSVRLQHLWE